MSEQLEYKYKLFKGSDDEVYVSVGLLMGDIKNSIEHMMNINIDTLKDEDKQIFDLKVLGLKTVYEFMGALQTEQWLKDKSKELNGNVPINTPGMVSVPITSSAVH
jgi:uncharacterized protein with ParB-like and HNH nuclease domain